MFIHNGLSHKRQNSNVLVRLLKRFADVWRGRNLRDVDLDTLDLLRVRAWIFQIGVSMLMIAQIISKSGSYFESPIICDVTKEITENCIDGYN